MRIVSASEAVRAVADGARVVLPHGCVEPGGFYEALQQERDRFRSLRLYSGLQFGDYPFLQAGVGENFRYATWQASAKLRPLFKTGTIDFLPIRFRDVTRVLAADGPLPPDVVVVQTTPPRDGHVNLGISVSLYRHLADSARLVIAELNANMPATRGDTRLSVDAIDLAYESDASLGGYRTPRRTARDDTIVDHVLGLVPSGSWVQLGVGAIPDATLVRLAEVPETNLHSGMLTDGLIDFIETSRHRPRVVAGEVCGSPALYDYVGRSDAIELHTSRVTHDLEPIGRLPKFVSINSAVEVDLHGQVNGETIDGLQISGVGGSLDFVDGAAISPGGMAIVALPSTTEDGKRSKIVRRLGAQTPVTLPRFCADYVVTEFGVARLRGKTLRERAEALCAIAHPSFHGVLAGVGVAGA
jgi:4-hydroxybutyrate CoA-transferase